MNMMFYRCSSLTSIDVSKFDTSNVTDIGNIFEGCSSLTSLDLSGFVTNKVTYMNSMFRDCSGLTSLDLSNFITNKVTDMAFMFKDCNNLKTLTLGENFYIASVESLDSMFENCYNLTTTITIKRRVGMSYTKTNMFLNAATISPAKITLNYDKNNISGTESMVNNLITDKGTSNLVKGIAVD